MKTELRQKSRLIISLFVAMIGVVPTAQAQLTITSPADFGTQSVGVVDGGALTTSGGTGPYTWTLVSGTLPPGVSIRTDKPAFLTDPTASAVLSGVAITPGIWNFRVRVTDATFAVAEKDCTLKISALVGKDYWNLPDAFVGQPYSHTLSALRKNGVTFTVDPVFPTWAVQSSNPPGLSGLLLNAGTGELSGSPTTVGNYSFGVTMTEGGDTVTRFLNLKVSDIRITTPGNLPNATQGAAYSTVVAASGGTGPYTFTASGLPFGLSMNSAGMISGTTTSIGPFSITVVATDSIAPNHSYSKRMSLDVVGVPKALPEVQPYGNVFDDCTYGYQCSRGLDVSSGGTAPFVWSVAPGTLPPGMEIRSFGSPGGSPNNTPADAELWGVPYQLGTFNVTVTVTDADGASATNTFPLKVGEIAWNNGGPTTNWTRGVFATQVFRIVGGPSRPALLAPAPNGATLYSAVQLPTAFANQTGAPPAGVTLTGAPPQDSGTPTENVNITTRLRLTETGGQQVDFSYFFNVGGGGSTIQISTSSNLGTVFNGASYSNQLNACCTANSIVWSVVGGAMPGGLNLSASGQLSANSGAMAAGFYTFMVKAADSLVPANFGQRQFQMLVTTNSVTNPSSTLPTGNVGTVYGPGAAGVQLTSTIGGGSWSLLNGYYLPPGLGLSAGGLISGTPTESGEYSFNVLVNSAGSFGTRELRISIYPAGLNPPVNYTDSPNSGPFAVGVVSIALNGATGGTGTGYLFSWSPSATPIQGMRIQNGPPFPVSSGFGGSTQAGLMGVVTTPGVYSTSVRVTDAGDALNFFDQAIVVTVSPLHILSVTTLPKARRGVAYGPVTLTPYGGTSYSWSATNLPPGVTIDSSTGVISGTPTGSGSQNYTPTITLTDTTPNPDISLNVGFTLTVNGFAIPTPGVLPQGTVGVAYSQSIDGSACTGTCGWSISGGTPAGVNFNTGTGVLSGTPTGTFNGSFTITRTSTGGGANGPVSKVFSLQVKNALPQTLAITTASPIYSTVGSSVNQQIAASGGSGSYTWTLDSGTLPPGIIINPDGALIGGTLSPGFMYLAPRAMEVGTYNFTLKVTDGVAAFVTKAFTWKVAAVNEPYTSIPFNATQIQVGSPFNQPLLGLGGTAVSGTGSYLWANNTPLPYGLSLDPNTGVLSGTPLEVPSSGNFPIQLTDTVSAATIVTNVFLNFASLPGNLNFANNGNIGQLQQGATFTTTIFNPATSGGTGPYTITALTPLPPGFALLSGDSLPANQTAGITIFSGVPQAVGSYSFTLRVQDSTPGTPLVRVRTFTFSVTAYTIAIPTGLPNGAVGDPYSQTLKTWSAAPVTWAPAAGSSLPPGLSVVAGVLTGTPTLAGAFTFQLEGTDSSGVARNQNFNLTIASVRITNPQVVPVVAIVGVPFTYDFDVASGSVTWTWASSLPDGLDLDDVTGVLSGTPRQAGTFTLNLTASPTGGGTSENRRFVLYIRFPNPNVLSVSMASTALNDATVGQVASYALTNSGGLSPFTWTLAGGSTLPPGLSLVMADSFGSPIPNQFIGGTGNSNTVPGGTLLAGVPTVAGSYSFDLIVTDSTVPSAMAARRTFTLKVSAIGVIAGSPRNVTAGVAYAQQFLAFGGTPPYTFTMSPVSLTQDMVPPGLNLSATGLLSGTTTSTGTYAFLLRIEDSAGGGHNVFTRRINLTSRNANGLYVSGDNPDDTAVGVGRLSFDLDLRESGFPGDASWSLVSGAFPPGVSFLNGPPFTDDDEWAVAGQPTAAGTFNFTVRATEVGNPSNTADHAFTWRVAPMQQVSPAIDPFGTALLPPAQVGVFYTTTIKMAGGTPPYTFVESPFTPLPTGLTLSSAGVLSGTPSFIGSYSIVPIVTDSSIPPGVLNSEALLVVTPAATPVPLTFFPDIDLPNPTVGAPFNFPLDLVLRGGTPPFTWNVQGGSALPAGLALLPGANGVSTYLAGVPTAEPPSSNFYLEAHDSAGQTTSVPVKTEFAQLSLTPDSLPPGIVGVPYPATQFTAAGGTGPYQILVYPGFDFPPGLTISPLGLLQGTPTAAGLFPAFIVTADSSGNFGDRIFFIAIDNPTIPVPLGQVPAVSLSPTPIQMNYTTGTADPSPTPISINATSGTFPFGLSLAGIPGATLSSSTGTAPNTSSIVWSLSGVGVGVYHGILAVKAGSVNVIDQVTVTLTVQAPVPVAAAITSPTPGTTLPGSSQTFQWNAGNLIDEYFLLIGSTLGGTDIYAASEGTNLSKAVTGLPTDGRTVYVRLWSRSGTTYLNNSYIYTAANVAPVAAAITSPTAGTTLPGSSQTFQWNTGTSIDEYFLTIGSALGLGDLYAATEGTNLSKAVTGLPTDGRTLYVRLWSRSGTTYLQNSYTYTAANVAPVAAAITSPTAGTTLAGSSQTFQWNAGSLIDEYFLLIGSTLGGTDLYASSEGTNLSKAVTGLPTDGRTVYVRLWSRSGTTYLNNSYIYTAANVAPVAAAITSPTPGTTLTGPAQLFQWNAGNLIDEYFLLIGSTLGGTDIYAASEGTNLSKNVGGIPTDGRTLFVRLWSRSGGIYIMNDYTYTAAP